MPRSLCPCGSALATEACCLPILRDHARAASAEALMRSRYTAFVLRDEKHILASWHPKSRPKNLNFDDFPVTWLGLAIHRVEQGGPGDVLGTVEFTSTYVENGVLCALREVSSFVREDGLWFYLRGECQVDRRKVERNAHCPCGSGKKFKRCCLLTTRPD